MLPTSSSSARSISPSSPVASAAPPSRVRIVRRIDGGAKGAIPIGAARTTSLAQLLAGGGAMPRGVALRIAIDVCAALEMIHTTKGATGTALGRVHREVSPQSVLVGKDGVARVTELRVASMPGKVGYMSPEVLQSGSATASSDMFAFGAVVWEMLAGRGLFNDHGDLDAVERTLSGVVPRLSTIVEGIPALLDVVVGKALAYAEIDRFASMQSLRVALEGAARGRVASHEEVASYVASITAR